MTKTTDTKPNVPIKKFRLTKERNRRLKTISRKRQELLATYLTKSNRCTNSTNF